MAVLARRFTIFTLIMTIFAFSFTALIAQRDGRSVRLHSDRAFSCEQRTMPGCAIAL